MNVVIPARNEALRLPDALAALGRQTYPRWEAIVVNDGSDDATGRIAEEWSRSESRLRVLHQNGQGLSAARNAALQVCDGDLIHFLDADDSVAPTFYEAAVSALGAAHRESPVGRCVVSRVALVWEGGEVSRIDPAPQPEDFSFSKLACRNVRQPVCHVFERRILESTGVFDESFSHGCEDWDLWLRFARVGVDFLPADGALALYRVRSDSLSSNWEGYLQGGSVVMRRALGPDERCPGPVDSPVDGLATAHQAMAKFWELNLLRAVNRLDDDGVKKIFEWGRRNLPDEFWHRPDRYGVRPHFDWTYDAPASGLRSSEMMWDCGELFVSGLRRHWSDLDDDLEQQAARDLLFRLTEAIETNSDGESRRIPRPRGIATLADAVGWSNPRPLVLWLLLLLPPALRRQALSGLRRLAGGRAL